MNAATFPTITTRFAWKEYRMLRGFWLAVAGLTFLEQWLSTELAAPGTNLPAWLLGSALFAAVLYAVGAAATSFAVEHEEETYHFLSGLPTSWPGLLVGKLFITTLSALALATLLALAGRGLGGEWPLPTTAGQLVGLFGVAILEAVAWGTLFSLLLNRPLVAAVLALLATTIAVHLAVGATNSAHTASLQLASYNEAIPLRLAIVAGVLLLCIPLTCSWLAIGTRSTNRGDLLASFGNALSTRVSQHAGVFASSQQDTTSAPPVSRLRTFSSLLWQTWRESWKVLTIALPAVALLLMVLRWFVFNFAQENEQYAEWIKYISVGTALILPALSGALVFHADQRRRQYRFLAEHAASPQSMWLARLTVWACATLLLWFVFNSQTLVYFQLGFDRHHAQISWQSVFKLWSNSFLYLAAATWFVQVLGFAAGQLCSMLLRSQILAVFLALVLSLVLSGWAYVVSLWNLSGWLFLVPLAVGFLVATWLRAPDWLAERNTWRGWWKPAAAILASFALVCAMLPFARLAQLPTPESELVAQAEIAPPEPYNAEAATAEDRALVERLYEALLLNKSWADRDIDTHETRPAAEEVIYGAAWQRYEAAHEKAPDRARTLHAEANRRFFAHLEDEAHKTAQMYLQAAEQIESELDDGPLDPWFKEFPLLKRAGAFYPNAPNIIPRERWDAYRQARDESLKAIGRSNQEAIRELLAASRRPSCRFDFDWSQLQFPAQRIKRFVDYLDNWPGIDQRYVQLTGLTQRLPGLAPADSAVESYIAALRMCAHLRERVPTVVAMVQLRVEQAILESFVRWAQQPERTDAELREAAEQLEDFFEANLLGKSELLAVDRQLIRDAIEGRQWPHSLSQTRIDQKIFLAYHANQLPWERERALKALDLVIAQNYTDVGRLLEVADQHRRLESLARWFRPAYQDDWPGFWATNQRAAATSFLMRYEYEAHVPIYALFRQLLDVQTFRNATLLQIALARYRLDHGEYPPQFSKLKPDYVSRLPIDPYSGREFDYRPEGLDLPLHHPLPVAAGIPLFWSVGPNDARLVMQHHNVELPESEVDPADQTSDQPNFRREAYYSLDGLGRWYDAGPVTVFPLPK